MFFYNTIRQPSCGTFFIAICEKVSFWLYYRSFFGNLFMLYCCNLFWIRVIVIIVLFQCKGGGLGEELVESADSGLGATLADWIKFIFSPSMFLYDTIRQLICGIFLFGIRATVSFWLSQWCFSVWAGADWIKLIFSPSMFSKYYKEPGVMFGADAGRMRVGTTWRFRSQHSIAGTLKILSTYYCKFWRWWPGGTHCTRHLAILGPPATRFILSTMENCLLEDITQSWCSLEKRRYIFCLRHVRSVTQMRFPAPPPHWFRVGSDCS